MTKATREAFLRNFERRAIDLAQLLGNTYLDSALIQHLDVYRTEPGHALWWRFSDLLRSAASAARYLSPASAGKRTKGDEGRRAYFVRSLTHFFVENLGSPKRDLVARATSAAFDDSSFTARQVQRLAPVREGDTSRNRKARKRRI
jgi:hypothetical protein